VFYCGMPVSLPDPLFVPRAEFVDVGESSCEWVCVWARMRMLMGAVPLPSQKLQLPLLLTHVGPAHAQLAAEQHANKDGVCAGMLQPVARVVQGFKMSM
jgi:hypothetical protein